MAAILPRVRRVRFRLGRRPGLDNRRFWDERYLTNPELGSGVGSRGDLAVMKRQLVESVWEESRGSVLDIGFGDLQVLDPSVFPTYTGVDVSGVAVERARMRFPQHTFVEADFGGREDPAVPGADLVLCLDVLIHQFDRNAYRRIVERIVARTLGTGLISAYNRPPRKGGPIVAFHEPIAETLERAEASRIEKVAGYRGLAVFRFGPPVSSASHALGTE